ncbi:MAG: hypothetical protein IKP11_04780 [Paludibacteraceae bacterium]|nr:hypothetical protein [Paludibacteraceae bacterium]
MRTFVRLMMMCVMLMSAALADAQQLMTRFMSVDDGEVVEAQTVFTIDTDKRTITVENTATSRVRVLHIVNTHEPTTRDDLEVQTFECTEGINRVDFSQIRSTLPGKPLMLALTYKLGDVKMFQETYMTDW